jgi:hypothetical protein
MHPLSLYGIRLDIRIIISLTLLITAIIIINSSLDSYATSSRIDFYSPTSSPPGVKSLEPLIAKWWNWRTALNKDTADKWPQCLKGDGGTIGNKQSLVFVGDPVTAREGGSNANARNQKCEISSSQLLYLTVYAGECSTGSKPHEGEFPDMKNPADLLNCAIDSNKLMKLMQVKVDGKDVSSKIVHQTTSQPFNYIVPVENAFEWQAPIAGGNNTSMAENFYLFFKPMPIGDHTIELEVLKQPLTPPNQPPQHLVAKWDFKVVP